MTLFRAAGAAGLVFSGGLSIGAAAQDEIQPLQVAYAAIEEITVFGSAGGLNEVPGAITYITPDDIERQSYTDILRTLRRAPGVNLQEEDGYGLRPNIGLRGSGADRSSRIMVMEDGVPVAPAPYAAPAAYYFPYAGRIHAVEVTKGPAVVKYGPRTTGGAINLYSTPIPEEWSARAEYLYGSDNGNRLHSWAGGRGNFGVFDAGFLIETFQFNSDGFKEIDAGGDAGFNISDYVVKAGLYTKEGAAIAQSLEIKFQYSDQTSNETYLGLTRTDFSLNPRRRYNASQNDQFNSNHKTYQLSYFAELTPNAAIDVIAYGTQFERDWFKLEKVLGVSTSQILRNPNLFPVEFQNVLAQPGFTGPDDALELRHNARDYYAYGAQAIATLKAQTGEIDHTFEASLRYHEDEVDRFQNFENFRAQNGALFLTSIEAPGSDSNRIETGKAFAAFFQDNIDWGRLHATLGVRVEAIDLNRRDFGKNDSTRSGANLKTRDNSLTAVSPAIGVVYDVTDQLSVLAGGYRGFSPPSPGNSNSSEEISTNYEAGFRWANSTSSIEAIGYFNAYENLLGTCTASTGGGCDIGDQFDGGEVDVYGLEFIAVTDAGALTGLPFSIPLSAVYTLTQSEFKSGFSSNFDPWGDVVAGDELPYVADHQLFLTAGVEGDRWGGEIAMLAQSERRAVAGQGPIALDEKLDAHTVFDFSAYVEIIDGVKIRGKLENAFNEIYIAAERPAGLRPGLPRTFWVGVDIQI